MNVTIDWNTYGAGQMGRWTATTLPRPASAVRKERAVPWSYYANVCTYGYSIDFIPWSANASDPRGQDWIRHIGTLVRVSFFVAGSLEQNSLVDFPLPVAGTKVWGRQSMLHWREPLSGCAHLQMAITSVH
jgi:hypothetical protein